jgi:hypothetical protein
MPPSSVDEESLRLHALCRGTMQALPKCPLRGIDDFAVWYTPGVAAPPRLIAREPEAAWTYTNRANTVAIVTDGTRVLGLGDIGPTAALPVMEGKALLFKYLGGVDAVPICLGTKEPDEIVRAVALLEPGFGAVNLEDIAQPKCFRILHDLRARLDIPVWLDDQQGSATALLAALGTPRASWARTCAGCASPWSGWARRTWPATGCSRPTAWIPAVSSRAIAAARCTRAATTSPAPARRGRTQRSGAYVGRATRIVSWAAWPRRCAAPTCASRSRRRGRG